MWQQDRGPLPFPVGDVDLVPVPEGIPDAPPSPLSVVLESKGALVFSGVSGGVVVADAARTVFSTAAEGAELASGPMPAGLPAEGRILTFAGRMPSSIWALFEEPKAGKDPAKNPFLRFERPKGAWKQYAEDWKPHLAAWSKSRILAVSTSSGKLKVKVVEPHQEKPTPDMPSPRLDDEACAKSLKVDGIAALASGEVFAAGHCKVNGGGQKQVVVRWAEAAPGPTPLPGQTPADAGTDGTGGRSGGGRGGGADAGAEADAGADATLEPVGVVGRVFVVPDAPPSMKHVAMVAQGPGDVWLLGADDAGGGKLYRLDGEKLVAQPLPKLDAPVRALAGASDGTLWMLSEKAIWKRYPPGEWEEVPPPTRQWPEPDPRWEMQGLWAGGPDVWIAAKHASSIAERHVVLRLRPAKDVFAGRRRFRNGNPSVGSVATRSWKRRT